MNFLDQEDVEALSAIVFTIVFVEHSARSITGSNAFIGGQEISIFISYLAVILTGFLAFDFWRKVLEERGII